MKFTLWTLGGLVLLISMFGTQLAIGDDKARSDAVTAAVAKAGYANPVVVGLSKSNTSAVFVLSAKKDAKNVIVAVIEPAAKEAVHPIELETDLLQGDRVQEVRFDPFIDQAEMLDVVVAHRPMQLEVSSESENHHVLKRADNSLAIAFTFDGNASSSHSKGMRTVSWTRKVSVEKVADAKVSSFDLKTVEQTIEANNVTAPPPPATQPTEKTVRYELTPSGTYEPVK